MYIGCLEKNSNCLLFKLWLFVRVRDFLFSNLFWVWSIVSYGLCNFI